MPKPSSAMSEGTEAEEQLPPIPAIPTAPAAPFKDMSNFVDRRATVPKQIPYFERQQQFEKRLLDFTGRVHTFINTMLGPVDPPERMNDAGGGSLVDIELDRIAEMEREINRAEARLDELASRLGVALK